MNLISITAAEVGVKFIKIKSSAFMNFEMIAEIIRVYRPMPIFKHCYAICDDAAL